MMQGKDWTIVIPKRRLKTYNEKNLVLERAEDVAYSGDFKKRLDEVKEEVKGTVNDGKLVRFSYSAEQELDSNPDAIGLNQMSYLDYKAMTVMARKKEIVPAGYGTGVGMIITAITPDGKFLYTIRTSNTSNWEGANSVFGGALSQEIGDTDEIVKGGTGRLISIMAKRAAQELGIAEKEINRIDLFGLIRGEIFDDHIFCGNVELSAESGKLVKKPEEMKKRGGAASSKYSQICSLDSSSDSIKAYLENVKEIIDVAVGGWALTTAHYWGLEKAKELNGVKEI